MSRTHAKQPQTGADAPAPAAEALMARVSSPPGSREALTAHPTEASFLVQAPCRCPEGHA